MENNFEKSLIELENIIKKLESEEVSLDESIALFEKGVVLSNECRKTLEKAENKIITLTDAEGENLDD
jgi:exodeoxyribonuclease VII small subunit